MKLISFGILALLGASSASAASPKSNLDKSGVILQGFDAISYFSSAEPKKGDPKFQTKFNDAIYYFASEADKQEFLKNPKKYEPQFAGWCAYAVANSKEKVEVDPKSFVIQDGRLLLFYNGIWANTREKWLKDPKNYLKTADTNWPEVEKKDP